MRAMSKRMRSAACLLIASFAAGCGGVSDTPQLAPVEGTVKLGGEPLQGALVKFAPKDGGAPSFGRTDENGWYKLIYSRTEEGAMLGEHRVEISTFEPGDEGGEDVEETGGVAYVPEKVPAQYNVNTELARTVEAGSNVHNFDLEAEGELIELRDNE